MQRTYGTRNLVLLAARGMLAASILVLTLAVQADAASVCGDVNDSGTVTSSDALAVLRKAVGQPAALVCAAPSAPVVTGETTAHGAGSDGVVQAGVTRSFDDNGDGTITDTATGLMWEKKDNAGGIHDKDNTYTWSASNGNMNGEIATTFLANLNSGSGFAGHKDWRVPNRFELESLLNVEIGTPSVPFSFNSGCPVACTVLTCSCTRAGVYWSSTTRIVNTTGAWGVNFADAGLTANDKVTVKNSVRAVRGGL